MSLKLYFASMLLSVLPAALAAPINMSMPMTEAAPPAAPLVTFHSWIHPPCSDKGTGDHRPVANFPANECFSYDRTQVGHMRAFQFILPTDGSLDTCSFKVFKHRECKGKVLINLGSEYSGAERGQCYHAKKGQLGNSVMVTDCDRVPGPGEPGGPPSELDADHELKTIVVTKATVLTVRKPKAIATIWPGESSAVPAVTPAPASVSATIAPPAVDPAIASAESMTEERYKVYRGSLSKGPSGTVMFAEPVGTETIPYGNGAHFTTIEEGGLLSSTIAKFLSLSKGTPVAASQTGVTSWVALRANWSDADLTSYSAVSVVTEFAKAPFSTPAAAPVEQPVVSVVTQYVQAPSSTPVVAPAGSVVTKFVQAPHNKARAVVARQEPAESTFVTSWLQSPTDSVAVVSAAPPAVTITEVLPIPNNTSVAASATQPVASVVTQVVQVPNNTPAAAPIQQPSVSIVTQFVQAPANTPAVSIVTQYVQVVPSPVDPSTPMVTKTMPTQQQTPTGSAVLLLSTMGHLYSLSLSRGQSETAYIGWPITRN